VDPSRIICCVVWVNGPLARATAMAAPTAAEANLRSYSERPSREKPVTKNELELEIQFARDGDNPGLDKFHVHIRCFAAWEFERNKPR
jgi:hypothetical protein